MVAYELGAPVYPTKKNSQLFVFSNPGNAVAFAYHDSRCQVWVCETEQAHFVPAVASRARYYDDYWEILNDLGLDPGFDFMRQELSSIRVDLAPPGTMICPSLTLIGNIFTTLTDELHWRTPDPIFHGWPSKSSNKPEEKDYPVCRFDESRGPGNCPHPYSCVGGCLPKSQT